MSDVQWLFVVLAALYGWECACWLRRGSVAFTTWFGNHWSAQHPGNLLGNQRGGFIFTAPLPPLGKLLTATQLPVSLSPDGVFAYVVTNVNPGWRPAQSEKFFHFDEIREIAARGKRVFVNGELFLALTSVHLAQHIAGELKRLVKLTPPQRETVIGEFISATLDTKAIKQHWEKLQELFRPVRLLANILFFYLFIFAPVLIWQVGFKLSWLGLLVGLFALTITTAVFFHRAHRKLYPSAEDDRFTHTLTIALAPMATMRAHDLLSRPLLEPFHPLAVARVFLAEKEFRNFARRVLLDVRNPCEPICPNTDPAARETELHGRTTLQRAVENMLEQSGIKPDELCTPPTPTDESCRSFCPRCGAQFTTAAGNCADCGGLALVAFAPAR